MNFEDTWTPGGKSVDVPSTFTFADQNMEEALNSAIYGENIIKLGKVGSHHFRRFYLHPKEANPFVLQWVTSSKKPVVSRINLRNVKEIKFGFQTSLLKKKQGKFRGREDLAVAMVYRNDKDRIDKDLNLVFTTPIQMRQWVTGIEYYIIKSITPFSSQ